MKPIRNKTYRNFILIMNYLMNEKHYDKDTAEMLTHRVFDNVEATPASDAWAFARRILSAEEYVTEYAR